MTPRRRLVRIVLRALLVLVSIVLVLGAVLAVRAAFFFDSLQVSVAPVPPVPIAEEAAAARLAAALRFRPISSGGGVDPAKASDPGELTRLPAYLAETFPRAHAAMQREVHGKSLLFTWPGRDPAKKPVLLAAHLDVVPVADEDLPKWTHPPFDGRIADGFVWGRGAMDVKVSVLALLEAVEMLAAEGR